MGRRIKWTIVIFVLCGTIFCVGEYFKFEDEVEQANAAENFFRLIQIDNLSLEEKLSRLVDNTSEDWKPATSNWVNAKLLYEASPFSKILFPWTRNPVAPDKMLLLLMVEPIHSYYLPWNNVEFKYKSVSAYYTNFVIKTHLDCYIGGQILLFNGEVRSLKYFTESGECVSQYK